MRHLLAAVAVLVVCAALPGPARGATVPPAQRCLAVKFDAAARAVAAHVSCEARAVEKSTTPRAGCHAGADNRLDRAFERIEAKGGCATVGDEGAVDQGIDAFVDALLAGATTGRCGATKLRAAARKAASDLACHRAAARKGVEPAAACLDKSVARFLATFTRAEKRGCGITGDAATVLAIVDAFVASTVGLLTGTPPTPVGTTTPTPTATATPNVPNGAPEGLTATIDGADVDLAWTAPAPASGNTHVRVLRRLNTAPTDAADGAADVVFFGTAASTTDAVTALLPTTSETVRTYHYAAFGCTAGGACESVGSRTTLAPTLVQVLRVGGYTLHWRHAAADVCSDNLALGNAATTSVPDWWKSCDANCGTATARQMNANGVAQSTTIGSEFDRLGIPVGRVISSEFCRNFTTAELMDFGPTIELRQDITFFVYDEANRCNASYALIDEVPAAGTNTAIIGHAGFTCTVLGGLAWGEAAIFKPSAGGDAAFVTRVFADGWDDF
jgi:hypothetical protein